MYTRTAVAKLLSDYKSEDVNIYLSYIDSINTEFFVKNKSDQQIANFFQKVSKEWLSFDWKHITLISTWISYDYVAYKNKMLLAYPESLIDIGIVYEWDIYSFSKDSWKITYSHTLSNPFVNDEKKIIGWYVVIKNKRWEFLTNLSKAEIDKRKQSAKTQNIWVKWFVEMVRKTLIKKACSEHFNDIFEGIEAEDNEQYDPNIVTAEERNYVDEINKITDLKSLLAYYEANEWKWVEFSWECTRRKNEIIKMIDNWEL